VSLQLTEHLFCNVKKSFSQFDGSEMKLFADFLVFLSIAVGKRFSASKTEGLSMENVLKLYGKSITSSEKALCE